MQFTAKVDYSKFSEAFNKIPLIAAKELRLELKPACQSIVTDTKANHRFNSKTNTLENGINYKVSPNGLSAEVQLNFDGRSPYAVYQHEGAPPHIIAPKGKKALAFVKGGRQIIVPKKWSKFWTIQDKTQPNITYSKKGFVNHPGIKEDKFLYKAAKRQEPFFQARIRGAVNRVIEMAGF